MYSNKNYIKQNYIINFLLWQIILAEEKNMKYLRKNLYISNVISKIAFSTHVLIFHYKLRK